MKTANASLAICICIVPLLAAQQTIVPDSASQTAPAAAQTAESTAQAPASAHSLVRFKRDTEVKLRLEQELSSKTSKVVDDVIAGGRVIVPRGTMLKSEVKHAKPAYEGSDCRFRSTGWLDFNAPRLLLANGKQVRLDSEAKKERSSDDSRLTAGDVGAIVLASPILVPALAINYLAQGVFMLDHPKLMRSHEITPAPPGVCHDKLEDVTLEKGRIMSYYVYRDIFLHGNSFKAAPTAMNGPPAQEIAAARDESR
jgi:hypothetical protein